MRFEDFERAIEEHDRRSAKAWAANAEYQARYGLPAVPMSLSMVRALAKWPDEDLLACGVTPEGIRALREAAQ